MEVAVAVGILLDVFFVVYIVAMMNACCVWLETTVNNMRQWFNNEETIGAMCVSPHPLRGKADKSRLVHSMVVTEGRWDGWYCEVHSRIKGDRLDQYWFSPKKDYQLRTLKEVHDFVESMRVNGWSEEVAWATVHGGGYGGGYGQGGVYSKRKRISHVLEG